MKAPRIIVVGGVAGGMSAAARARRLSEEARITVFEAGPEVSFANCGLPYHVSGEIPQRESLLLHTPESLRATLNLDVHTGHRVSAIDLAARTVTVESAAGSAAHTYDALVLATGAEAFLPPIPGIGLPHVRTLRTVDDAVAVAERAGSARTAAVLGAGFIGLEAAEALRLRGLDVTIVELASHVLPVMEPAMASYVEAELTRQGLAVRTGVAAASIDSQGVTLSDGTRVSADLVIAAMGVRPRTELARAAGLELDPRGAIIVDSRQRTSDPHIWAVGDAAAVTRATTGVRAPVPLAGPANRQGRRAADAIVGTPIDAAPVLGTAIVRTFDLTAAVVGASPRDLITAGIDHEVIHLHPLHHAGYFPGATQVHLAVTFTRDGVVVGAQAVGKAGVDKRIDVLATAIRAGMTADDLAELELAYAPPYGSAKDPINLAGMMMVNLQHGTARQWYAQDLDSVRAGALIIDVRSEAEFASGHLEEAVHLPHTQIRDHVERIRDLAQGRPVRLHCQSGMRSYLALRVLAHHGLDVAHLAGGMLTLRATYPELALVAGPPTTSR